MDFKEVITRRHSVRKYTGQSIDRQIIDEILEEALLAPSSKNSKSSCYMVIDEPGVLEALSLMRDRGSSLIKGAAAAIVVMGDTEKTDLWVDNASISATYLMLSATARGIGSCWVHVNGRQRSKEDPAKGMAEEYVRDLLGIKDNLSPLCVIALGYEAQ